MFDGKCALAGSCNGMSDMWEFVPSSSCVKSSTGTNLALLVSISLFTVLTGCSLPVFVWCNAARRQRDLLRRCRGVSSWKWKWSPSHSSTTSQRLMVWWNDLSIRPWCVKVLKCAECVTCVSESEISEKKYACECVSVYTLHPLVILLLSIRHFC